MDLRLFSNGGGVQSTAALVLSAHGEIDYPVHVFANVGERAEHPDTLRYVREVAMPYAERHGIEFVEVRRRWQRGERAGQPEDLYDRLTKEGSRSLPIPVRMANGAPGRRACTADFKIRVLSRFAKERGATAASPALVGLGISMDEWERMRTDSGEALQRLDYPLIDLRMTRDACAALIAREGLPVPPKSSCWFCPFHRPSVWMRMRHEEPELFERAAQLEDLLNERRATLGKDPVWLTRFARPLRDAIGDQGMLDMEIEGACEAGYCMT